MNKTFAAAMIAVSLATFASGAAFAGESKEVKAAIAVCKKEHKGDKAAIKSCIKEAKAAAKPADAKPAESK